MPDVHNSAAHSRRASRDDPHDPFGSISGRSALDSNAGAEVGPPPLGTALSSFSSVAGDSSMDAPTSREAWEVGSVVEVFSATLNQWYPARVMQVKPTSVDGPEVLTVQFTTDEGPKMKSTYRKDANLAVFGSHLRGELPPGFQRRPSQSRPGQTVYFDATTGTKYVSSELAWRIHLERLLCQPATAGLQTVCKVPSTGSSAVSSRMPMGTGYQRQTMAELAPATPPALPSSGVQQSPAGPRPMTLAELHHQEPLPAAATPSGVGGKTPLPTFGDARVSSQAAYLGYMGTPGMGGLAGGPIPEEEEAQYRTPVGARVPSSQRPPVRACNPQLQVWHEDPFSQWRG